MIKVLLFSILLALTGCAAHAVDLNQIEKELTTTGAVGWIHGSSPEQGLYVFTYRNPQNFFDYVQMSLVTRDPALQAKLATLNRHDQVKITGSFLPNPSPQKHIKLLTLEVVTKYKPSYDMPAYEHTANVPDALLSINQAQFLIHAIAGDGHILVLEYGDTIVPAFIENGDLTKGLFRGDVIEITFKTPDHLHRPTHLEVDEAAPSPIKVIESIKALHGTKGSITGALILFPKSPEIKFNVFAVQQILPSGLKRQYTLVNFDDMAIFQKIRDTLQAAWDRHPNEYVNGRNKLVSQKITVTATGTFNEVDPNQANPQILLNDVTDLQIVEKP